ncbi:hypothetical protein [Roseicyclus amphidinii]|uniref:hypothetical protein n=1 Tax=Roseicyclus amphidinii TaxID=3034232 RepID=UPI0024E16B94|nr:hypothetical protein [Roseicyclus sp. Amp-Y-6]
MHPDPHVAHIPARDVVHVPTPSDEAIQLMFLALYRDLSGAFEDRLHWIRHLERPRWWQLRAMAAHRRVRLIFLSHGFLLTDGLAWEFMTTPHRAFPDEDSGGALIRRLRMVFQWQMGVPYAPLSVIEGGRVHEW